MYDLSSLVGVSPRVLGIVGLICLGLFAIYGALKLFEDDPAPAADPNAGTGQHVETPPTAAPATFRIEKSGQRSTRAQRFCLVCGRELAEGETHGH